MLKQIPPPVVDNLGRIVSDPFMDPYPARIGIGLALRELSSCLTEEEVSLFVFDYTYVVFIRCFYMFLQ